MKISIVGMSGSGKTYWSKKLESEGFKRFCCDDLIEEKLEKIFIIMVFLQFASAIQVSIVKLWAGFLLYLMIK